MENQEIKFSVLIPTSIDRGLVLPHSIASVQRQSIQNFEILIVGDGANEFTKNVIFDLMEKDHRIRFFDFPKHPRRGEENRHKVLTEDARGKYIAYLCDRDLMLPNHLETLEIYLQKYDFASTSSFNPIEGENRMTYGLKNINSWNSSAYLLSCDGHTLDFYKKLPFGWRTTPDGVYTDMYMWEQFIKHPECRSFCGLEPTILWFKRGDHPGMSSAERKAELLVWEEIMSDQFSFQLKKEEAMEDSIYYKRFKNDILFIRVKGRKLSQVPKEILKKIKKVLSL